MAAHEQSILSRMYFNSYKSAVIVEFLGTALYVATFALAALNSNYEMDITDYSGSHSGASVSNTTRTGTEGTGHFAPMAGGFMLMAVVFAFAYISGGHFNPCITIATTLIRTNSEPLRWHKALLYVLAQFAGAFAAVFYALLTHGTGFPVPHFAWTGIIEFLRVYLTESVFTFVLASIVLHVSASVQKDNAFYGFATGMGLMAGSMCVGGIPGGTFNPAHTTALTVVKCFTGQCMPVLHLWIYLSANVIGTVVAALLYNTVADAIDPEPAPGEAADAAVAEAAAPEEMKARE